MNRRLQYTGLVSMAMAILFVHAAPGAGQERVTEQVRVTASAANVRLGGSTSHGIIITVPQGTVLPVLVSQGEWYRVALTPELGTRADDGFIHVSTVAVERVVRPEPAPSVQPVQEVREVRQAPQVHYVSDHDALIIYSSERKSEFAAVALELMIPMLGHAYAGNAKRGLTPLAVSAGGFILMIASGSQYPPNPGMATVGYLAYLGGRAWGAVSAHQTASDHNAGLRRTPNITLGLSPERQPQIGLSIPVAW